MLPQTSDQSKEAICLLGELDLALAEIELQETAQGTETLVDSGITRQSLFGMEVLQPCDQPCHSRARPQLDAIFQLWHVPTLLCNQVGGTIFQSYQKPQRILEVCQTKIVDSDT